MSTIDSLRAPWTTLLALGRVRLDVEPAVYGTVILMTVFAVALDDGIESFTEAAQLAVGSMVTTSAAHLFAALLAHLNAHHALPDRRELGRLVGHSSQFLALSVVPLGVVALGASTRLYGPEVAVDTMAELGVALLLVLGGVGGWRAGGRRWWTAAVGALTAVAVGAVVLVLKVLIEH